MNSFITYSCRHYQIHLLIQLSFLMNTRRYCNQRRHSEIILWLCLFTTVSYGPIFTFAKQCASTFSLVFWFTQSTLDFWLQGEKPHLRGRRCARSRNDISDEKNGLWWQRTVISKGLSWCSVPCTWYHVCCCSVKVFNCWGEWWCIQTLRVHLRIESGIDIMKMHIIVSVQEAAKVFQKVLFLVSIHLLIEVLL